MNNRKLTKSTKVHRKNLIQSLKDEVRVFDEHYEFKNDKKTTKYIIHSNIGTFEGVSICHDEDKFVVWKALQISKKRARRAYDTAVKVYLDERYIIPITRFMDGYISEAVALKYSVEKLTGYNKDNIEN